MRIHSAITVGLLAFTFACKGEANKTPVVTTTMISETGDPHELVGKLDKALIGSMERRDGTWTGTDAISTWRAYVGEGVVRRIDEVMTMTDGSSSTMVHYFTPKGRLILTNERLEQHVQNTGQSPGMSTTTRVFGFVGDSATSVTKMVNGENKPFEKYEIENARAHAFAILELAKVAPPSKNQ